MGPDVDEEGGGVSEVGREGVRPDCGEDGREDGGGRGIDHGKAREKRSIDNYLQLHWYYMTSSV
jgi:hypothetical protein